MSSTTVASRKLLNPTNVTFVTSLCSKSNAVPLKKLRRVESDYNKIKDNILHWMGKECQKATTIKGVYHAINRILFISLNVTA